MDWAALLFQTGAVAFGFLVPVLSGFIAYAIADRPGLVPGFVGGAISVAVGAGFLGGLVTGFIGRVPRAVDQPLEGAQGRARRHAGRRHPAAVDVRRRRS